VECSGDALRRVRVFSEYDAEIPHLVITDCDGKSLTQSVKSGIPTLEHWNENISLPVSRKRCGTCSAPWERAGVRVNAIIKIKKSVSSVFHSKKPMEHG
jgi:hypothetical protein